MDSGNFEIVNVMFHQLSNFQTDRDIVFYFGTECKFQESRKGVSINLYFYTISRLILNIHFTFSFSLSLSLSALFSIHFIELIEYLKTYLGIIMWCLH